MAVLYGDKLTKREFYERIGHMSQAASVRFCKLEQGRAQDVKAADVKTGSGLNYTILLDRCMDIAWAEYKGIPLGFITKSGITAPEYYEPEGTGWLRSFYGGLLTTCGFLNVGSPSSYEGMNYGSHGRASNLPAEDTGIINEWLGDEYVMGVYGTMKEAHLYRENVVCTRRITSKMGENRIIINDRFENQGFKKVPFMILYHMNFGYPIIGPDAKLIVPGTKVTAGNQEGEKNIGTYDSFHLPEDNFESQVYHHDLKAGPEGFVTVKLENKKLDTGFYIRFNKKQLKNFTQWKHLAKGDYVVGLEPSNNYGLGIEEEQKKGTLEYLQPGEVRDIQVEFGIL